MNKVPFGKHKGKNIEDIPDKYLSWVVTIAKGDFKMACLEEIYRRFNNLIKYHDDDETYHHIDPLWDFGDN